jgi:hypothetical protein
MLRPKGLKSKKKDIFGAIWGNKGPKEQKRWLTGQQI